MCTSLRLSGISTVSQESFWTLGSLSSDWTVVLGFLHSLYTLPEVIVPISGVQLSDTFRTISGIRISAFLVYPTRSYCAYFWCALLLDFQVLLLLVRRWSELFGVSAQRNSGIRISAFLIYPTRSYFLYFWFVSLCDFPVSVLLVRRGSELLEFHLRLTVVLGFLHSVYTLPEVIEPISGVHLSETFRYFYC